jgi:hypothetical protein
LLGLGRDSIRDCSRLSCRFERANLEVLAFEHGFLCVVVAGEHDRALLSAALRLVGRRFLQGKPQDQLPSG